MFNPIAIVRTGGLLLAIAILARVIADFVTQWSIRWAAKRNALAEVNERSSHSIPVARVGGIGIAAGLVPAFVIVAFMIAIPNFPVSELQLVRPETGAWFGWLTLTGLVAGVLGAFALGLYDDLKSMPPLAKLLGQVAVATIPVLLGLRLDRLHLPGMSAAVPLPIALAAPLSAAWLVLMMNAFNFMDGINGLAGRFAQIAAIFTFLGIFGFAGGETMLPLAAGLYGAVDGFLKHNIPTAKTFMGDCGSQMLGMYLGLMGMHLTQMPMNYPPPFVGFVIIVSLLLFDVKLTLVRRLILRKPLLQAHRDHLYQRYLITQGGDHEATLGFVESHLFALGLIGAAYLHFAFGAKGDHAIFGIEMTVFQTLLILAALGVLMHFCMRASAKKPDPG